MFSYISSTKFSHSLQVSLLAEETNEKHLTQVCKWVEEKWGYLADRTMQERMDKTRERAHEFYLVKYANILVGMFRLCYFEALDTKKTLELTHVFVDESMRYAGVGGRIVESAKKIAQLQGADFIVLETLNPMLNSFYQKHNASVVCESRFLGFPTDMLKIKVMR